MKIVSNNFYLRLVCMGISIKSYTLDYNKNNHYTQHIQIIIDEATSLLLPVVCTTHVN